MATGDASAELSTLRYREPPRACSYLPEETAAIEYRFFESLSAADYEQLLLRGWRRHGMHFFRPGCPQCTQCRSLRVPVREFAPSKSQRRTIRRNRDCEVGLAPASVSAEHVALYNAWHADQHVRRGWRAQEITIPEYAMAFLSGDWPFAYEMRYYRGDRLAGVGLVDLTPHGLSSVYFYYDPAWRPLAPGVFSALREIELCRTLHLDYWFVGYWIAACPSMSYKADYRPHEVLEGFVSDSDSPSWRRFDATPAGADEVGE